MISFYNDKPTNNSFERLLDNFWGSYHSTIDLQEEKDKYTFSLELPGFKKSQIKITTKDHYLTIVADDKNERQRSKKVAMPKDLDLKKIKAKLEDGILYVSFAKPSAIKPREILIE